MQGSIKRIEFNTKIGINEITVNFSTTLETVKIPEREEIKKRIKKEFSHDFDLWVNAMLILSSLQPYCYEVSISPQLKGSKDSYTIIVKK